jgi:hypothetical protein
MVPAFIEKLTDVQRTVQLLAYLEASGRDNS